MKILNEPSLLTTWTAALPFFHYIIFCLLFSLLFVVCFCFVLLLLLLFSVVVVVCFFGLAKDLLERKNATPPKAPPSTVVVMDLY